MKLRDLKVSELNIRLIDPTDPQVEDLVETIQNQGLISRLVLRKNSDGSHEIVAGQRRYYALCELHGDDYELPESEYIVKDELSDKGALLLSVAENQNRRELSPMELNKAALKLNQVAGLKEKEIAKVLNVSPYRIKRLIRLGQDRNKMPVEIQEELKKVGEDCKFNDAHWEKIREETEPGLIKDVFEHITSRELSPKEVPKIVDAVKKARAAEGGDVSSSALPTTDDGAPEDTGGPIEYSHKGQLVLEEHGEDKILKVIGKGEDQEIPISHYMEYLKHPDKFKCMITFKLKIKPVD